MFLDEVMELSINLGKSGALFRERIEELVRQARLRADSSALEIETPGDGEFLIGDVPALTVRNDHYDVGVLGGITLDDAHSVFLPLGPGHIAALAKKNLTAKLTTAQVKDANARQVRGAHRVRLLATRQ